MFDVGFQELTLIGVIALIVVGPERPAEDGAHPRAVDGQDSLLRGAGQERHRARGARRRNSRRCIDKPARELDDLYKVAEETKGTLDQAKSALGEVKSAFDSEPASISTPNEPAAGSIFPTELPGHGGPEQRRLARRRRSHRRFPRRETVPVGDSPGGDKPGGGKSPAETSPAETSLAETSPAETVPEGTSLPDTGETQSGEHRTSAAATDAGENDERSSGRI